MAHSLSAKKRVRQNFKQRATNRWRVGKLRDAVRDLLATVQTGKVDEAKGKLPALYKLVDQIAAKESIHKNAAARYKSRLTARVNKAAKPAVAAA
jgi:small subunit ribosomal protein S20